MEDLNLAGIVFSHVKSDSIFIGEGYSHKEKEKSLRLANIIAKALNENETN